MKLTRKKSYWLPFHWWQPLSCELIFSFPVPAVARQGIQVTKAAAAHYDLTSDVDASNVRQVIPGQHDEPHYYVAV